METVKYKCISTTIKNVNIYYAGTTQEWLAAEKEGAFPGVIVIGGGIAGDGHPIRRLIDSGTAAHTPSQYHRHGCLG